MEKGPTWNRYLKMCPRQENLETVSGVLGSTTRKGKAELGGKGPLQGATATTPPALRAAEKWDTLRPKVRGSHAGGRPRRRAWATAHRRADFGGRKDDTGRAAEEGSVPAALGAP